MVKAYVLYLNVLMVAIENMNFDFKGSQAMLANLTSPFSFPICDEFVSFGKSETTARRNKTPNASLD